MADDELQPITFLAEGEDRHLAISEILAELRGEIEQPADEHVPAQDEAVPALEPPIDSEPEPEGVEQDEDSEPVAEPPAGEPDPLPSSPAPHQREADPAGPRPTPHASTPLTLILLHAVFLAILVALGWLGYRQITGGLQSVEDRLDEGGARAALPAGAADPRAGEPKPAPDPLLEVDDGLRYTQAIEQADFHFEKGEYVQAAAAYQRALDVMPASWNDGAAAFRLGECYFRVQDYPQAINAYDQVKAAYPSRFVPRALFQSGEAHLRLKAYVKAREAFYDLLLRQERYRDDAEGHIQAAYFRIGDCYRLEAEELDGSKPEARQPESPTGLTSRGSAEQAAGSNDGGPQR